MRCLHNKSSTRLHVDLKRKCLGVRSVMGDTVYDGQLYSISSAAETGQLSALVRLITETNVMEES